jgi:cytidylate kinase
MNHLKMIQQFLKEKRDIEDIPDTGFPFVTISRQSGAGGHLLASILHAEFVKRREISLFEGWHVFDRELCDLVARDPLLLNDIEQLMDEKVRSKFDSFVESLLTGRSESQNLERTSFKVVRMLALIGKVILVGRGSALITADLPQSVHIRLVAPEAHRIARVMKNLNLNKDDAREMVETQDAARRKLIKLFFQRDIEDPLLYDIIWNTGKVSVDIIAQTTLDLLMKRSLRRCEAVGMGW